LVARQSVPVTAVTVIALAAVVWRLGLRPELSAFCYLAVTSVVLAFVDVALGRPGAHSSAGTLQRDTRELAPTRHPTASGHRDPWNSYEAHTSMTAPANASYERDITAHDTERQGGHDRLRHGGGQPPESSPPATL
jgi:hypothetical protein